MNPIQFSTNNNIYFASKITAPEKSGASSQTNSSTQEGFGKTLDKAVNEVNKLQQDAQVAVENVGTGKSEDIHKAILSLHKADLGLRLSVEVRNKAVDAYQEIMRMPV